MLGAISRLSSSATRRSVACRFSREFHFASKQFAKCLVDLPEPDMVKMRQDAVAFMEAFDSNSWYSDPVRTLIRGKPGSHASGEGGSTIKSIDAFSRENGVQIYSCSEEVDEVIAHLKQFTPEKDYREKARAVEDELLAEHAGLLIGNQALDFLKQDGVTELGEWAQAAIVERRLTDNMLDDEARGIVEICRDPAFVGCVSNFSNFLDLSRKVLRNIEAGVPVVIPSRSNTSQHMYRWCQLLLQLMEKHGLDTGLVTYLAANRKEKNRVMEQFLESPFYLTSSRETAASIKEINTNLMASTGGPNTMVATEMHPKLMQAATLSTLIENSGQCTAMRHLALGKGTNLEEISACFKSEANFVKNSLQSLKEGKFAALFDEQPFTVEDSYSKVGELPIAVRVNKTLPAENEIDEHWRETYLDVTPDIDLENKDDIRKLCRWLNEHQPISCAVNGVEPPLRLFREIFEGSALVVYTMGSASNPALTAQARPQEGEIFGEFPPRHELRKYTKFPMVVPSPGPAYNAKYSDAHLLEKSRKQFPRAKFDRMVSMFTCPKHRGYTQVIIEYLVDACAENPKTGGLVPDESRTSLYGLQKPPAETHSVIRSNNLDSVLVRLIPFLATNAADVDNTISVSSSNADVVKQLKEMKIDAREETEEEFKKWAINQEPWNILHADYDKEEFALAGQFVSLLFPLGHVKSTKPKDAEFVRYLAQSSKWLKVA